MIVNGKVVMMGGNYAPGDLLGRIGENGTVFVVATTTVGRRRRKVSSIWKSRPVRGGATPPVRTRSRCPAVSVTEP